MNNNTRPPTLTATIVQMPMGHIVTGTVTHHAQNPYGRTITVTLMFPITVEVSISPEDLHLLKAA